MKKRLTHVDPYSAALLLATMYGLLGLVAAVFFVLAALAGNQVGVATGLAIAFPLLYAAGGFIGGYIGAALYNLVAQWTGGIEFEFSDVSEVV